MKNIIIKNIIKIINGITLAIALFDIVAVWGLKEKINGLEMVSKISPKGEQSLGVYILDSIMSNDVILNTINFSVLVLIVLVIFVNILVIGDFKNNTKIIHLMNVIWFGLSSLLIYINGELGEKLRSLKDHQFEVYSNQYFSLIKKLKEVEKIELLKKIFSDNNIKDVKFIDKAINSENLKNLNGFEIQDLSVKYISLYEKELVVLKEQSQGSLWNKVVTYIQNHPDDFFIAVVGGLVFAVLVNKIIDQKEEIASLNNFINNELTAQTTQTGPAGYTVHSQNCFDSLDILVDAVRGFADGILPLSADTLALQGEIAEQVSIHANSHSDASMLFFSIAQTPEIQSQFYQLLNAAV
uniref:Uncharacterized protein n=1 Tax=Cavenderia fasciculata TaxID=261658 RepID=B2XX65_CACFS|nr:hypothetical protein Difao_mp03 [Cavenderia fasciculata]ABX45187.1 hypothetical protein [Cavenderia fasciculata]